MNKIETEEHLICEALVREIRSATRWSGIVEAWDALLYVRLLAKQLKEEQKLFKATDLNKGENINETTKTL